MNLFPYILGPVWVLDVTLTPDGHTIAAWRCKMGCEPQQTVYDAAAVAKGVAVVTVSGHGTIVKPADSQLAARVRDDHTGHQYHHGGDQTLLPAKLVENRHQREQCKS